MKFKLVTVVNAIQLMGHNDLPEVLPFCQSQTDQKVFDKIKEHIDQWDEGEFLESIIVENFELDTDFVLKNPKLVDDIATGKAFRYWYDCGVEFYDSYFGNFLFVLNQENKWVSFQSECEFCDGTCPVSDVAGTSDLCDEYSEGDK